MTPAQCWGDCFCRVGTRVGLSGRHLSPLIRKTDPSFVASTAKIIHNTIRYSAHNAVNWMV